MTADARELPFVPEPVLSYGERIALSEAMRDPAFWDEFERLPEPNPLARPRPCETYVDDQ